MSDILIKNMKMPKSCMVCPLYYYDEDYEHNGTNRCTVLNHTEIIPSFAERREDCPLIEVNGKDINATTNADRIRNMTDEELADEILRWFNWLNAVEWDDNRIIEWLKQEVEDG